VREIRMPGLTRRELETDPQGTAPVLDPTPLGQEGHVITKERAACLSPYRKDYINRFGAYFLDELREKMTKDFGLPVVPLSN
jgi:hypothetical protein